MNQIIIESTPQINTDAKIFALFENNHQHLCQLILESVQQNFFDYIDGNVIDLNPFLIGTNKIINSLLENLKENYIDGNRLKKELLIKVTEHASKKQAITFEELMLDFPIGHALFTLNWYYHAGHFREMQMTDQQKQDFCKGVCIGAHMTSFAIFLLFRYEIFQDFTFIRFIKNFINKKKYIEYPEPLKEIVYLRSAKFNWSLILGTGA